MTQDNTRKKLKIRVGDTVEVIAGKDKGHVGKVLLLDRVQMRLVVEGANMVHRHTKPNQANQQGGIIRMEAPIHYSNVLLYDSAEERGVRVRIDQTDPKEKRRVSVKSNNVL